MRQYFEIADNVDPALAKLRQIQEDFAGARSDLDAIDSAENGATDPAADLAAVRADQVLEVVDVFFDKLHQRAVERFGDETGEEGAPASLTELQGALDDFAESAEETARRLTEAEQANIESLGLDFLDGLGLGIPEVSEQLLEMERAAKIAALEALAAAGAFDAFFEESGLTFDDLLDRLNESYDQKLEEIVQTSNRAIRRVSDSTSHKSLEDLLKELDDVLKSAEDLAQGDLGPALSEAKNLLSSFSDFRDQVADLRESSGYVRPHRSRKLTHPCYPKLIPPFAYEN